MHRKKIVIATRQSPLALWQTRWVAERLQQYDPALIIQLAPIMTQVDRHLEIPLNQPGSQGIFAKELEHALLEQRADLAVHSIKDLPVFPTPGLALSVFDRREDVREALVTSHCMTLAALPRHASVGTSSLLRQAQLAWHRPDLTMRALRGDIATRLEKLALGNYDALILAVAGLKRLGLSAHISAHFSLRELLPAVGQGALGVQYRINDREMHRLLTHFEHPPTQACIRAERALARHFAAGGRTSAVVGAYARASEAALQLRAVVFTEEGIRIQGRKHGPLALAEQIGVTLANKLLAQG